MYHLALQRIEFELTFIYHSFLIRAFVHLLIHFVGHWPIRRKDCDRVMSYELYSKEIKYILRNTKCIEWGVLSWPIGSGMDKARGFGEGGRFTIVHKLGAFGGGRTDLGGMQGFWLIASSSEILAQQSLFIFIVALPVWILLFALNRVAAITAIVSSRRFAGLKSNWSRWSPSVEKSTDDTVRWEYQELGCF